jgi:hypothetical protein
MNLPQGTVTFLRSDIEGSMRQMDPDEALDFLEAAIAAITETAPPSATEAVRPGQAG